MRIIHALASRRAQLRSKGLGRTIISIAHRLGIPITIGRALARVVKILVHPVDYLSRRMNRTPATTLRVSEDGFIFLNENSLPGLVDLRKHCETIFEAKSEKALSSEQSPFSLIKLQKTENGPKAADTAELLPIIDFLCNPALVGMAADYIGEEPVLGNICLWWSNPGNPCVGPQLIHRDMNAKRQLHLVIPIRPVDQGTGPFTFLPAPKSRIAEKRIRHMHGRVDDDVFPFREEMIAFTSEKGDALVVNPYACFHFGGRATENPRYVLICSYTSAFENAEEGDAVYRMVNRTNFENGKRKRLLMLQ